MEILSNSSPPSMHSITTCSFLRNISRVKSWTGFQWNTWSCCAMCTRSSDRRPAARQPGDRNNWLLDWKPVNLTWGQLLAFHCSSTWGKHVCGHKSLGFFKEKEKISSTHLPPTLRTVAYHLESTFLPGSGEKKAKGGIQLSSFRSVLPKYVIPVTRVNHDHLHSVIQSTMSTMSCNVLSRTEVQPSFQITVCLLYIYIYIILVLSW